MRTRWLCLAASVALVLGSCSVRENVIARVGDREIEIDSLQRHLESVAGVAWQDVDGKVASRLMDQFLDQEVVLAAAGVTDPELLGSPGRRSAEVRGCIATVCGPSPEISEDALRAEMAERLKVDLPARVRVRQMVLDDHQSALDVRQRLTDGEDFVELSCEVSRAPNALSGGELGMIEKAVLTEELDDVIFSLAAGEISAPVEGPAGHHIFQVLEIVPAGPPSQADVEVAAAAALGDRLRRTFVRDCVDRLAAQEGVNVFPDHLWFRYSGCYSEEKDDVENHE